MHKQTCRIPNFIETIRTFNETMRSGKFNINSLFQDCNKFPGNYENKYSQEFLEFLENIKKIYVDSNV